ncbi:MAG TPA: phage portal protein [Solirubrobacteraceae bacterium]|nr:phage portal protein [Solirubrobacteraceae bacterium]
MAVISLGSAHGRQVPATLADWLDGQDVERMQRYRGMLDFYEGTQWQRRARAGETQLTINYARALVRKAASYVFPAPVLFSVPTATGLSDAQAAAAETALNELHAGMDLYGLDVQTLVDAAVLGDGAFKVTWDVAAKQPLVTSVDPAGLWAWTAPDNVRELVRVAQRYTLAAWQATALFGADGVDLGTGESAVRVVEEWTATTLRVEVAGRLVREERNPYGWIPYVVFPNVGRPHELWGESDLVDLLDTCRELNRRMTVISRILQVAGNPIVVLENVTGSEGIRADEGAVWELPEASRAYLLDMLAGGGVRLHLDYVEALYRALYDLAETPRSAFGDSGRNLSGAALEVEIQPLVQKVQRKRRVWDSVYRRRNALLLDLLERFGGLDLGGVRRTTPIWGPILPNDREAAVRSEVALVGAQVHSRQTAMSLLGDEDPETEWQAVLDELEELAVSAPAPPAPNPAAAAEVPAAPAPSADELASGAASGPSGA